jgi:hypothetical protein
LRPPSTTPRRLGCSGVAGRCLAVRVAAGVYRYAVVAGDAWARSEPVL